MIAYPPFAGVRMKEILLVDDSPVVRTALADLLAGTYRVTEAEDGRGALRAIQRRPFDVMVLDMQMPVLNGEGVLKEIAARRIGLPVIAISAADFWVERALQLGAADALRKPFEISLLTAAIEAALESQ
jgi:CheY-like chemotaxis protein